MVTITKEQELRTEALTNLKSLRATVRGFDQPEFSTPYHSNIRLCLERARLVTQSYQETEGEPVVMRRAKALAKVLENMSIYIREKERIVGNVASTPNSFSWHPECYCRWLDRAVEKEYGELIDDEGREEVHEIAKYWMNKAVQGMERDLLPEEVKPYWAWDGPVMWMHGAEAGQPNYEKVLKIGLNGIIKEAEDRLREIGKDVDISARDFLKQRTFLEAVVLTLKGAIKYGERYAEKAKALAKAETDQDRKKELEEIAEICSWVPANPARTFHEAIQSYFFIYVISRQIDVQMNGDGVRFDQIMFPFYKKDKEEGRLTREEARNLVELLFLKLNIEGGQLRPRLAGSFQSGGLPEQLTMTLGGVTPEGDDATNEVSYIVLDACKATRLQVPDIALRYHENMPKELIFSAIDLLKVVRSYPKFFNDKCVIPKLVSLGIPLEDARDYCIEVCVRWMIPGKNMVHRQHCGNFQLPKVLEYALNRGVDKFSGKKLGYPTPDPLTFTSIGDVIEAYLTQLDFYMGKWVQMYNITDALYEEYLPRPFFSALTDGCIERGQDCREWRYFAKTTVNPVGQITLANSLAVINKLVFQDKTVSMAELLEALRNNWEGKEELRQKCVNEAPKFGNDDDEVDLLARDVIERTTKVFEKYNNLYDQHFVEDGSGGASYFAFSALTGATPDGRKDKEEFNDGTISPVSGTDKKGPTAVLKSVSKIDPMRTFGHLFNQKFSPQLLENNELFAAYLKTWADLGINHIQFNVITPELLRDAQKHPEQYRDLVVRVAGYCAYFVDLARGVQDQIVARTWQELR